MMRTAAVALAAAGWGLWSLFLRGSGVPAVWQSILILSVIAAVWLLPALRGYRERSRRAWALLALLGVADAANYVLFFAAVDRGPVQVAVLTHYLEPVVVAVLAPAVLREPLRARTVAALAAALVGLVLLVGGARADPITAALGAASAFFYAANVLLSKLLFEDFSPAELLAYHCGLAALLLLPFAGAPPPFASFIGRPLIGALFVGAGGAAVFYWGLLRVPAQRAAVLTYLEPLVASMVGAVAFGERLGVLGLGGAALILGGGLLVVLDPQR